MQSEKFIETLAADRKYPNGLRPSALISANLNQLWLTRFDRGELNDEGAEASVIAEYEAQIAALERKIGQLTKELGLVKKTPRQPIAGSSEKSSIVTGLRKAAIRSHRRQPFQSRQDDGFRA